jgi:hypothetical protein
MALAGEDLGRRRLSAPASFVSADAPSPPTAGGQGGHCVTDAGEVD